MISIRRSLDRGQAQFSWLKSFHTFSFGEYYDPEHMHFRTLRVMNEDYVAPSKGFDTHPHKDMEILTYVISGAIRHKDSMGSDFTLKAGQIQIMSAGTGIYHSEHNASSTEPLHLYQIWILPQEKNLTPRYADVTLSESWNEWVKIGSPTPIENGVQIMQDVTLYRAKLKANSALSQTLPSGRFGWLQVVKGTLTLQDETLSQGDGVSFSREEGFSLTATSDSEVLFFELA